MKTVILVTLLLCAIASASPVWLAADATFQSKYIWRGAVSNAGAVLQPWAAAGIGGAAVTVWGNMDLTDENTWIDGTEEQDPTGKFTEIDLILNYSEQFGPVALTAGFNKYWYPNTSNNETAASEITLAAGYSVLLNPTVTVAFSMEDSEGTYTGLGLSVPVSFPYGLSVTPMLEYSSLVKSEISDEFEESSNIRGGLSLTYYFI